MVPVVLYLTSELPSVIIEKTGNTSTISFFVREAILMYSLFIYGNKKAPAGDSGPYSVLQLPSVR